MLLLILEVINILVLFMLFGHNDYHSLENTGRRQGVLLRYMLIHSLDYTIAKYVKEHGFLPLQLNEVDRWGHLSDPDNNLPIYIRFDNYHGFLIWEGYDKYSDMGKKVYDFNNDYLLGYSRYKKPEWEFVTIREEKRRVNDLISGDLVLAISVIKDETGTESKLAIGWLQPLSSVTNNGSNSSF